MFETLKTRYTTWKKYSRTVAELETLSTRNWPIWALAGLTSPASPVRRHAHNGKLHTVWPPA